ncbi:MAG: hypothetical protein BWY76_00487 [bacterium ADurb.Bin429]|nr:MAG: hypothetical protein BWY76_00487 [bacterium ADurb.Bin429]
MPQRHVSLRAGLDLQPLCRLAGHRHLKGARGPAPVAHGHGHDASRGGGVGIAEHLRLADLQVRAGLEQPHDFGGGQRP